MLTPPAAPAAPGSSGAAFLVADRHALLALNQLLDDALRNITDIFTDMDGTLATEGKLLIHTHSAPERLYHAGTRVVPTTGRSIV